MPLTRRAVAADIAPAAASEQPAFGSNVWLLPAFGVGVAAFATLLAITPDIFVPDTGLGWVDAWYDVGFSINLPEKLARYHMLYQSERIGWMLPAYLFNRVAPPLIANYMVKGAFLVATAVFLFGAIREITGSVRTAGFVSGLAVFHSFLVHSLGTSYVDGPMNTYMLGTIYFGTRAFLRTTRFGSAFAAGVFFGGQLFSHLLSVVLVPSLAIYFLMTWTRAVPRGRQVAVTVVAIALGVVSVLAGVAALYAHWQPNAIPLRESIRFFFLQTSNSLVQPSGGDWLRHALWLLLPTTVALWIVMAVASAVSVSWAAALRLPAAFWLLLGVYGCWVALYFVNQPWLALPFYSSCLIPPTFLALGPIAAGSVEALSLTAYRKLLGALFVGSGLAYWLASSRTTDASVLAMLACILAATVLRLRSRWQWSAAFPALLVAVTGLLNYGSADYSRQLRNGYAGTAMAAVYPSAVSVELKISRARRFDAAVDASARLDRRLAGNSGRPYFFWYDRQDELGMFYRSMTSLLFAWSTSHLIGEDFRDFDQGNRQKLAEYHDSGMRDLVILTRNARVIPPDSRFRLRWSEREEVGGVEYFIHYLAFEPMTFSKRSPSTPAFS